MYTTKGSMLLARKSVVLQVSTHYYQAFVFGDCQHNLSAIVQSLLPLRSCTPLRHVELCSHTISETQRMHIGQAASVRVYHDERSLRSCVFWLFYGKLLTEAEPNEPVRSGY